MEVKQGFAGMEIGGVTFTDKAEAGKALLAACSAADRGSEDGPPFLADAPAFFPMYCPYG